MEKRIICFILFIIILITLGEGYAITGPANVDNLKKYDFDTHDDPPGGKSSVFKYITTFFLYLIVFVTIALLAYFTTRWVGKHQSKLTLKSKYMKVIDSLPLDNDRGIYILKAPQGFLLLGVTKEGIYLLEKLGDEEAELIQEAETNYVDYDKGFSINLGYYLNKFKGISRKDKNGGLK